MCPELRVVLIAESITTIALINKALQTRTAPFWDFVFPVAIFMLCLHTGIQLLRAFTKYGWSRNLRRFSYTFLAFGLGLYLIFCWTLAGGPIPNALLALVAGGAVAVYDHTILFL